jgi:hypothetical protein
MKPNTGSRVGRHGLAFVGSLALIICSGCDFGSRAGAGAEVDEDGVPIRELRRKKELEERFAEIRQRTDAKLRLEADLLTGRVSMRKAVDLFRAIQKRSPHVVWEEEEMEKQFPGLSEWERYGRSLIAFIRINPDTPDLAGRVATRLEKELDELVRVEVMPGMHESQD